MARIRPATGLKGPKAALYGVGLVTGYVAPVQEWTGSGSLIAAKARTSGAGLRVGESGNRPPAWSLPSSITLNPGQTIQLSDYAVDPDGGEITFGVASGYSLPSGVTLSPSGALVAAEDAPDGSSSVAFTAADATAVEVPTFTVSSVAGGAVPFTTGHVFKKGDAFDVKLDTAIGQVDVRNRWDDGSLKFVVASGVVTVPANGSQVVSFLGGGTSGAAITEADLIAINPSVSLAFSDIRDYQNSLLTSAHSVTLASCLGKTAVFGADPDAHQSGLVRSFLGPAMSEFHYYRTTNDRHLRVWWYVRVYATGHVEVETVVENGWFNVSAPGVRRYTGTLTVAGTQRAVEDFVYGESPQTIIRLSDTQLDVQYARYGVDSRIICYGDTTAKGRVTAWETGNVMTVEWDDGAVAPLNPTSIAIEGHMHHTKWQRVDWLSPPPDAAVAVNGDYWKASKLIPNFIDHKIQASRWYNAVDSGWFALNREDAQQIPYGDIKGLVRVYSTGAFSNHGIQTPILSFEVLYLRDGFQQSLWANEFYTRAEQFYSIFYRDEVTGLPVSPHDYVDKTVNGKYSGGTSYGVGGVPVGNQTPEPFGRPYYYWDDQHSFSLGYIHYLITGRWTSLEKMAQQFSFGHFMQNFSYRGGAQGLLYDRSDRGFWTQTRDGNLVASMLPDAAVGASAEIASQQQELRDSAIAVVENRIQWVYDNYVTNPECALGYLYIDLDTERINIYGVPPDDIYWLKMWMKAMTINGFARGWEVEVPISAEKRQVYRQCLDHAWNWIAGALGRYETTGHPWRLAFGPYVYAGAPYNTATNQRGPLFTTWQEVYENTWNNPTAGPLSGWYSEYVNEQGVLDDTPGLLYMNSGGNNTPFTYRNSYVWHTILYLGNVMYGLALGVDAGHAGCISAWNIIRQIGNAHWFDPAQELSYSYPSKCIVPRALPWQ